MTRRSFLASTSALTGSHLLGASKKTPNIVVILCDDLGYGDLGCYGSRIRTPNLNRMAGEGIRFTNFSAADPVCSPSRAALLTGRYPTRVGVPQVLFPKDPGGLNLDETTVAGMLRSRGYGTMCIGKWHLGRPKEYLPTSRGFDEYFGIPYSNDMTPCVLMHNTGVIEDPANLETLTRRYTEQAVKFIRSAKDSPFFLYMPHTFPHIPLAASPRFRGKSAEGLYGDTVEEIDWSAGEVLRALHESGVEENTLVLFTSDNGPWYQGSPGKLRGRKNTTYEGGVREPFIARWPGRIPKGKVCDGLASMMDIFPTVARLCGADLPPKPLDGIDIWPLLAGEKQSIERPPLLYFNGWNLQCARSMNWKLHVARFNTAAYVPGPPGGIHNYVLPHPELYDLSTDPDESYDTASEHPEIVKQIQAKIEELIPTFPAEVRQAYVETLNRKAAPTTPAGAYPRAAQ
ncbi:MAG TPA: sulfatase [Bryobacteraceae bacterium]|jgi:arylsulfatase|nr:sulfatase [Bryobacteraceae bacterium]